MNQLVVWAQATAVTANAAYGIPATANLPANAKIIDVQSTTIVPAAGSTTAPVTETGIATGSTAPAAGQVSVTVDTQKFYSGDAIAANSLVVAVVTLAGQGPVS